MIETLMNKLNVLAIFILIILPYVVYTLRFLSYITMEGFHVILITRSVTKFTSFPITLCIMVKEKRLSTCLMIENLFILPLSFPQVFFADRLDILLVYPD
jgi:hypothetical protein